MATELLCNFDSGLVDESASARTLTVATGITASNAAAKFGSKSLQFTDNGGYLNISGQIAIPGDFTAEFWLLRTSAWPSGLQGLLGVQSSSQDYILASNGFISTQFTGSYLTGTTSIPLNAWNHVALSRIGDALRLFLNGVLQTSATYSSAKNNSLRVGLSGFQTNQGLIGTYLDGLRIITDRAIYTQNFTLPTTAPTVSYPDFNEFNLPINLSSSRRSPLLLNTPVRSPTRMPLQIGSRLPSRILFDLNPYKGNFRIQGTVSELGTPNVPLRRRVDLVDEISGVAIKSTWSDAVTGAYSFDSIIGTRKFSVISYDYTGLFRAVIADNLTPEAMP